MSNRIKIQPGRKTLTFSLSGVRYTTGTAKYWHIQQLTKICGTELTSNLDALPIFLTLLMDDARNPDGSTVIPLAAGVDFEEKANWVSKQIDLEDLPDLTELFGAALSNKMKKASPKAEAQPKTTPGAIQAA